MWCGVPDVVPRQCQVSSHLLDKAPERDGRTDRQTVVAITARLHCLYFSELTNFSNLYYTGK